MRARAPACLATLLLLLSLLACSSPNPVDESPAPQIAGTDISAQPAQTGLFGRLFGGSSPGAEAGQAPAPETGVEAPAAPSPPPATGLFGFLGGGPAAVAVRPAVPQADYPDVSFGASVPYGQIARVCGVPDRRLGKVTGQYPARGAARFRLHDSDPGGQGLRAMYLTGFGDGCARQFTASLALFGSFQMHELLRYGLPARVQPYSATDDRYEVLKRQVCGVRKGKPCGPAMSGFARNGVFVSIYERFEGNPRWKNLLLYKGQVVAFDLTGP